MLGRDLRSLCVTVHDVAPATWPACERLLTMLDGLGIRSATLLIVPCYHRRGGLRAASAFRRAIDARLLAGDEVALHGYFHVDDSPPPTNPIAWCRRRLLTASEAEFAALSTAQAQQRLAAGLQALRELDWPVHGFVAPAWQLGAQARRALAEFPFDYTATRRSLWCLPHWQRHTAPSLVYSVRSRARRRLSRYWNDWLASRTRHDRLLRVALHPADAQHADVLAHWRQLLAAALWDRLPMTEHGWLSRWS